MEMGRRIFGHFLWYPGEWRQNMVLYGTLIIRLLFSSSSRRKPTPQRFFVIELSDSREPLERSTDSEQTPRESLTSSKSSKSLWSDLGNSSFGNLSSSASRYILPSFTVFSTLNSRLILLYSSNYEAGTLVRVVLLSLVFSSVSFFPLLSIS
jgi:hypothetical protein